MTSPYRRRGHPPWWWFVGGAACAVLVVAGLILVITAGGSGAAPLPPRGVTMSVSQGSATMPSVPASSVTSFSRLPSTMPPATAISSPRGAQLGSAASVESTADHQTVTTPRSPSRTTGAARDRTPPAATSTAAASPIAGSGSHVTASSPSRHPDRPPSTLPPHTISIPVQAVTAPVVGACRMDDGVLYPPSNVHQTCWWGHDPGAVSRGEVSVVTSHVNYVGQGWGALSGIARLRPGDRVYVTGADHRPSAWAVVTTRAYTKSQLPRSVFTDTVGGAATLRLVTCGGQLDPRTRHYRDNVVTTLVPARSR